MATSPYAAPLYVPKFRAFDTNGDPLNAGKVYTYAAGTATPLATYPTYADALAGTNANANPVVLDANGEAAIFLTNDLYKIVVKTSADVTQYTVDSIGSALGVPYTNTADLVATTFFSAIKSGNQAIGAGAVKVITWTVEEDAASEWDNANNRWTCVKPGKYAVFGSVEYINTGVNVSHTLSIYKNGAVVGRATVRSTATGSQISTVAAHLFDSLVATDYIEIYLTGDANTTVQGTTGTRFSVMRVV